ncbi:MAG: aminotransferase class V-fold PLP-dependent enzyme [Nitrospinota bacterium]|nr:aminotransferase class V-fold PLP-dependent enzyme [Nitrospinota bacterium]
MDIQKIRKEFPVTEHRLFMDHARVAPLARPVQAAITAFAEEACEQGTAHYAEWLKEVEIVRARFAKLINADTSEVAFVKNTSEGLSIVANGIDWKEGDNVVIPDIEFPANVYPWMNLQRRGVDVRFVKSVRGRVPFEQIASQVNSRTRVLSISSVEFNSGYRNDLKRIGEFCKEKNIYFCVDAIQSLGVIPMDVKEFNIDFLAADGHKWMLSVEGLGGFYISQRVLDDIHPAVVGWDSVINSSDYGNYDFTLKPDATRFEEGSLNTLGIYAFGAALALLEEEGIEHIEKRVLSLGDCILEYLRHSKFKILSSTEPGERSGSVCFGGDIDYKKLAVYLRENKVIVSVRDNFVRLSPHFYNTEEEIDQFFALLDEFLKQ